MFSVSLSRSFRRCVWQDLFFLYCLCLSRQHLLNCWSFWNHWTFSNQTWYGDASSYARVLCENILLLCLRPRSQSYLYYMNPHGIIKKIHIIPTWLSPLYIYIILWTADPFWTKLSLMVHHHKLECHVKTLLYNAHGQGHSERLTLHRMCVQTGYGDASSWARVPYKKIVRALISEYFKEFPGTTCYNF